MSFCPHVCIWQSNWAIHYVWNIYCYRVNNLTNKKSCWSFDQSEGNGVVFCGTFRGLEFHRLRRTGSWLICSEKMTEDDNKNTFFKTWFEFFSFLFNAFQWDSLQKMSHSAFSARQWKAVFACKLQRLQNVCCLTFMTFWLDIKSCSE